MGGRVTQGGGTPLERKDRRQAMHHDGRVEGSAESESWAKS